MENNYRKARVSAGIKSEVVAATIGVSISTLFNWERGDTQPSADNIVALARLYGVSTDYLLGVVA